MIYFVNQDYFPSKVAGGSAKSILLLTELISENKLNSKVIFKDNYSSFNYDSKDIVVLNSVFGSVCRKILFRFLIKKPARCIIIPRGELLAGAIKNSSFKKHLYIKIVKHIYNKLNFEWVATSVKERDSIELLIKPKITPILNSNLLKSIPFNSSINRTKDFCSIGRLELKKNQLFLKNIKDKVDLFGALSNEKGYIKKIDKVPNLIYLGNIDPDKMSELYSEYKINLLPTLGENYGHVIVESILSGTPVIVSDTTPWSNVIKKYKCGEIVDFNSDSWNKAILKINNDFDLYYRGCNDARNYFLELNEKVKRKWEHILINDLQIKKINNEK
jgi:glycosyltransferase involved in cell wall biosynthesis